MIQYEEDDLPEVPRSVWPEMAFKLELQQVVKNLADKARNSRPDRKAYLKSYMKTWQRANAERRNAARREKRKRAKMARCAVSLA